MKKISKQEGVQILNRFIENELQTYQWFSDIKPHLKAILLYGSTAKGTNRPDSDVDMLLVLPLEFEEAYTKGEYFYDFEDRSINIVLRSIEGLRRLSGDKNDSFQSEVFRDSEILWEQDSEVGDLLKQI